MTSSGWCMQPLAPGNGVVTEGDAVLIRSEAARPARLLGRAVGACATVLHPVDQLLQPSNAP